MGDGVAGGDSCDAAELPVGPLPASCCRLPARGEGTPMSHGAEVPARSRERLACGQQRPRTSTACRQQAHTHRRTQPSLAATSGRWPAAPAPRHRCPPRPHCRRPRCRCCCCCRHCCCCCWALAAYAAALVPAPALPGPPLCLRHLRLPILRPRRHAWLAARQASLKVGAPAGGAAAGCCRGAEPRHLR